jgi:hypothetical protein
MLNRHEVSMNPKTSRILKRYLNFANLEYPKYIDALASQELIKTDHIREFTYQLEGKHLEVIQHIDDFQGRGLIVDNGAMQSRACILAWLWLKNNFPCIILTRKDDIDYWSILCERTLPNKKVVIDLTDLNVNDNLDGDVIITQVPNLMASEYLVHKRPKQFIFENINGVGANAYEIGNIVQNLSLEVYQSLFIMDTTSLFRPKNYIDIKQDKSVSIKQVNLMAMEIVKTYLYPNASFTELTNKNWGKIKQYLDDRKYNDYSREQIMELLGVNLDLIKE